MSLKRQAVHAVKYTVLSAHLTTGLQLLQLFILARLLTPQDFGLMAMVMVFVGFIQGYGDMGISAAIIHRQDITKRQLASLYWLNIVVGFLMFALLWAVRPLVVMFFKEPRLMALIPVIALNFLISPWGTQFQVLLRKELRFNILAKQEVFSTFIGMVVAITTAWFKQGVWSLVWGGLAASIVGTVMLLMVGWSEWRPLLRFSIKDLHGFIGFGLYQMGERSINYFSERFDQLLIGRLLGAQAIGYYNFAFNLAAQPVSRINPIVTRVSFPIFAKIQHDSNQLQRGYLKLIKFLTTINAPLLIGLAVTAPMAIPLLFGNKWTPSVTLVQILALVFLFRSIGNPVGSLQLARGRADLGFKWNLVLFFTTPPMLFLGAQKAGGVGIALALLLLQVLYAIPSYLYLVRPLIGPCALSYAAAALKPITLACLMGVGVWLVGVFASVSMSYLIAEILIGGVLYAALTWFFDRKQLLELKKVVFSSVE
jgi:lipopolysaccharide exporter